MTDRKKQPRWMKSAINEAQKCNATLPWNRQLRAIKRDATPIRTLRVASA